MPFWKPEKNWLDEDVFVIGGGVSLKTFDWPLLRYELTIGCNDAYTRGKDITTICVFGDGKWFKVHKKNLHQYAQDGGVVFTSCPQLQRSNLKWVWILSRKTSGFHVDCLGWSGNTGANAINLALLLGAKRIYLLGFDMHLTGAESNWHENNLDKPDPSVYKGFLKKMSNLNRHLELKFPGVQIFNVTRDSSLNVFPKIDLDLFFQERTKK